MPHHNPTSMTSLPDHWYVYPSSPSPFSIYSYLPTYLPTYIHTYLLTIQNPVLRFANTTFWWFLVSGIQLFWKWAIYERYISEPREQFFVDM